MKRAVVVLVAVVLAGALVALFAFRVVVARRTRAAAEGTTPPVRPVVQAARVVRRDVTPAVELIGSVKPRREVDVFARVPGRAEQVLVEVGDAVRPGQLLAVVEHGHLEWQSRQAGAQVRVAQAALDQARLAAAAARRQHGRVKELADKGAAAPAELDQVESALQAAEAAVRAADSQLGAARAAAGLAGATLDDSRVVSPIAGTVIQRMVELGGQLGPAQPLFRVQDLSALRVDGAVAADAFARLRKGQPAEVVVDDRPGEVFAGSVATLSPSLDPVTRRAAVGLEIDNTAGKLLPNMFAHVRVVVGARAERLAVPAGAVVSTPEGAIVYTVKDGKVAIARPTLGASDGGYVIVEAGLAEGAEVAVAGQVGLADGAEVTVAAAPGPEARP